MFQLTKEEFENWKSQIATSNIYSQEEMDALKMGQKDALMSLRNKASRS